MIKFEKISKYAADDELKLPERKTAQSAGYDFMVAEDTVIPSYAKFEADIVCSVYDDLNDVMPIEEWEKKQQQIENKIWTLKDVACLTKELKCKPTLVPTGIKAKLMPDTYLELSVRSSCPLKHWLILANGVGRLY